MANSAKAIQLLKEYFAKEPNITLAFLFGSRAKGRESKLSDWDIAVYFKPHQFGELETKETYPKEEKIWSDITRLLDADVDLLVLNRARPPLVFSVLRSGTPLALKNRGLYLNLLLKTHYEAVDFGNFVYDFWKIRERSASLSPEDRTTLIEHLIFLENEFHDVENFQKLTWKKYQEDRDQRRSVERWIENLVMTSLDIAKIILASEKKDVPQTYKETLGTFGGLYFDKEFAERFSQFAEFRNIIAHEYLDIRWDRIRNFILEAQKLYPNFINRVKELAEDRQQKR